MVYSPEIVLFFGSVNVGESDSVGFVLISITYMASSEAMLLVTRRSYVLNDLPNYTTLHNFILCCPSSHVCVQIEST